MKPDLWHPLLALLEGDRPELIESSAQGVPLSSPPSARLKEALTTLSRVLQEEMGESIQGGRYWLLLDVAQPGASPQLAPSPLQVSRVLEEIGQRFLQLQSGEQAAEQPNIERFLREKMRALGFEELGSAPLLPELQREALRGLGVGIGSQMAQLLGRMAGWHGEAKAGKEKSSPRGKASRGVKLLRLELGADLAADKNAATQLRADLHQTRRRLSLELGWELGGLTLSANKELAGDTWRLSLRGDEVATGAGFEGIASAVESLLRQRADALLSFVDFEAILGQPGCKLVAKELRAQGLEKSMLWTVFRRVVASGGHLREPLTVLERILEASATSHQLPFLVQAALSGA